MSETVLRASYEGLQSLMKRQGYHFVNEHTVVKTCLWTRQAILRGRFCYKCVFYGIESHRCIQMSPAAYWCWNDCIHCWRVRPADAGLPMEVAMPRYEEDVEELVEKVIGEQRRLLSGFLGNPRADKRLVEEAMQPRHVAISLTGEPTLYDRLPEMIRAFHRRGLTTFLVTRGVRPDVLERLAEEAPPTQLYVSVEAYDKGSYAYLNKPLVPRAWELTLRSLELMRDYPSPTVLRITLIRGLNMSEEALRGFARLTEISQPKYVELKAYMHVGTSTHRLSRANMPSHAEVLDFARRLSQVTGLPLRSSVGASRVVLLSPLDRPLRHGPGCPGYEWRSS